MSMQWMVAAVSFNYILLVLQWNLETMFHEKINVVFET